jgi:hypothetical protein
MELHKLIQVKVSTELYNELIKEAVHSGLTISQVCRLRLSGKKIIDKNELDKENKPKFRPVHSSETKNAYN